MKKPKGEAIGHNTARMGLIHILHLKKNPKASKLLLDSKRMDETFEHFNSCKLYIEWRGRILSKK